ncbi:DUF58 domain-containing protein [Halothermothrix orenii]|uniref:Uncharacterized conserved protein (Some members contain a von Willebrand factor type A (VWA) domain) n=1 Tax=Halothermothrix orenii (strain H 168 / OCM 544 / DSM 9562) TaxID=373903 RepID=B8CZD0_HALOH|nr:DUF58 domain-containing protein [Halothermothrix orenii]ACL70649.1 uncharacterized conserved protein (some members contain a von Willebrand factor type A (vWA) domain) [Halothermothrix orenii H 168]
MFKFIYPGLFLIFTGMLFELHEAYYPGYIFICLHLLIVFYNKYILNNIHVFHKIQDDRIFLTEKGSCQVKFQNKGRLPVFWLKVTEILPRGLGYKFRKEILSLKPGETKEWNLELKGIKRGYYRVGPLRWETGDIIGYEKYSGEVEATNPLIVYPRVKTLEELGLPSRLPFGEISWPRPIYQDPTQVVGIRDYNPGDSIKRVHWKATARTGNLQVKKYRSTVALEVAIILNLNSEDYGLKRLDYRTELAITTAASLGNYLARVKQPFSLLTNGKDPFVPRKGIITIPVGQGEHYFQKVLELLARIEINHDNRIHTLLDARPDLQWGSSVIIITALDTEELIKRSYKLNESGYSVRIIVVGDYVIHRQFLNRPFTSPLTIYRVGKENDLHGL